jgi:hypothetical protein
MKMRVLAVNHWLGTFADGGAKVDGSALAAGCHPKDGWLVLGRRMVQSI